MTNIPYRVLARKYRPQTFADLVGQDVLVRTLSNAIQGERMAHAVLLTGIRGIGKTTTARIIARALNCLGSDGNGRATPQPCGICANCKAIAEGRHVDVLEMDAASHTGVGDMRDLIETVHYAPTSARYKVYIIDEVHMLSNSAFNALLKTLEEPPPHVIFIFATTELRKIPVTIVSRCQRFDLKRLDTEMLTQHLGHIAQQEHVAADEDALRLIALAAEGSVRDGLSLLDRAIAHGMGEQSPRIDALAVRHMLGLADRSRLFALLEATLSGEIQTALDALGAQYRDGADLVQLLQELLALVHILTRLQIAPTSDLGPAFSQEEKTEAAKLAQALSVADTTRAWQMLLKGVDEVKRAPDTLAAAEMVFIRLAYAAQLPSPADLIRSLQDGAPAASHGTASAPATRTPPVAVMAQSGTATAMAAPRLQPEVSAEPRTTSHLQLATSNPLPVIESWEELQAQLDLRREAMLLHNLTQTVVPVSIVAGQLEIAPLKSMPSGFPAQLATFLEASTRMPWRVLSVALPEGGATLTAQKETAHQAALRDVAQEPVVKTLLSAFVGAQLTALHAE
ncbi:MAG: DNA polymerase III subunit gamma/tau [Rickettsiales bacterium]|nr:DNA polymerase III subunit gamma/tau [Rickettsiales bacterium]